MEIKCEYCGAMIPDTANFCPQCGAPNQNMKRTTEHTPKTIEELAEWYKARNLPPYETTRFFIGINYQEPRAFGIYEENGKYIVYKNKDDGSRAVRYEGTDEAYAVNELYLKLKSEILNQKAHNQAAGNSSGKSGKSGIGGFPFFVILMILVIMGACSFTSSVPWSIVAIILPIAALIILSKIFPKSRFVKYYENHFAVLLGVFYFVAFMLITIVTDVRDTPKYYEYGNNIYCYYSGDYYVYDNYDYSYVDSSLLDSAFTENRSDYQMTTDSVGWDSEYNFEDSNYYQDNFSSDDDDSSWSSDSDYDWSSSSDSWDSGSSDWSSDW